MTLTGVHNNYQLWQGHLASKHGLTHRFYFPVCGWPVSKGTKVPFGPWLYGLLNGGCRTRLLKRYDFRSV